MSHDAQSLSGKVYLELQEDILSGKYKKGDELKEQTIGEELGVSRTPVREALRQLERQGLVSIIPNKGAKVIGITREDMYDIFEIRSTLEGMCAQKAAQYATPEEIEELEDIVYMTEYYAKKGNSDQIYSSDNKFHETLYGASHSRILEQVLSNFHHYLQRVRKVTLQSKERAIQSNEEHRQIVEAIRQHDGELAQKLADDHIMSTIRNIERVGWENILK